VLRRDRRSTGHEWTIVSNIAKDEYSNPVRVVSFNVAEGWSRNVTEDIAKAVIEMGTWESHFSKSAIDFVQRTLGVRV
jgi:hypothetical protein